MNKVLESYLKDIDTYLRTCDQKNNDDVLKEIEYHILEDTKITYGEITDDGIKEIIEKFGSAKDTASQFFNDLEVNDISGKKMFWTMVNLVFLIHSSLYMIMLIKGNDIFGFFSSFSDSTQLLFRIVSIFAIFAIDVLVLLPFALGLYKSKRGYKIVKIISRNMDDFSLASISLFRKKKRNNYINHLLTLSITLLVEIIIYIKFKTLFIIGIIGTDTQYLADDHVSRILSLAIIILTGFHVIYYLTIDNNNYSDTSKVFLDYARWIMLWSVITTICFYVKDKWIHVDFIREMKYLDIILIIIVVLYTLNFCKNLISRNINYSIK